MPKSKTTKSHASAHVRGTVSDKALHSDQVFGWRQSEFERLGFASYVSEYLASTRIDLHQMEGLLKKGCPHDLAAQILKDTFWGGEDPGQFSGGLVYADE